MTLLIRAAESGLIPDRLVRFGIRRICRERLRDELRRAETAVRDTNHVALDDEPIAVAQEKANRQHYELPAEFFKRVLGRHLKYSCGLWRGDSTLDEAEELMLEATLERAGIIDGMTILDLGCGWGSFALFAAERLPRTKVLAVSNSASQRRFIEGVCRERRIDNIRVRTADVATLELSERFDRVVSIEMFEHMRNYSALLKRIAGWLEPAGKLFTHIFAHRRFAYPYETSGANDWMARTFFTGGQMPSADLLRRFDSDLTVERQWHVDGRHYQRTANAWLMKLDHDRDAVLGLFRETYGQDQATLWLQRWRLFFMACAELFGYRGGSEWGVEHILFEHSE
jgi:cyclopropane-fatty-acyl-phospholipid synthase